MHKGLVAHEGGRCFHPRRGVGSSGNTQSRVVFNVGLEIGAAAIGVKGGGWGGEVTGKKGAHTLRWWAVSATTVRRISTSDVLAATLFSSPLAAFTAVAATSDARDTWPSATTFARFEV